MSFEIGDKVYVTEKDFENLEEQYYEDIGEYGHSQITKDEVSLAKELSVRAIVGTIKDISGKTARVTFGEYGELDVDRFFYTKA